MKCPNCDHDMTQSRAGWLCSSCGHIETSAPTLPPLPGGGSADQPSGPEQPAATVQPSAPSVSEQFKAVEQAALDTNPADGSIKDTDLLEVDRALAEMPTKLPPVDNLPPVPAAPIVDDIAAIPADKAPAGSIDAATDEPQLEHSTAPQPPAPDPEPTTEASKAEPKAEPKIEGHKAHQTHHHATHGGHKHKADDTKPSKVDSIRPKGIDAHAVHQLAPAPTLPTDSFEGPTPAAALAGKPHIILHPPAPEPASEPVPEPVPEPAPETKSQDELESPAPPATEALSKPSGEALPTVPAPLDDAPQFENMTSPEPPEDAIPAAEDSLTPAPEAPMPVDETVMPADSEPAPSPEPDLSVAATEVHTEPTDTDLPAEPSEAVTVDETPIVDEAPVAEASPDESQPEVLEPAEELPGQLSEQDQAELQPVTGLGEGPEPIPQAEQLTEPASAVPDPSPAAVQPQVAEAPLMPVTHPKPLNRKVLLTSVIAGIVMIALAAAAYFALAAPRPSAKNDTIVAQATATPAPSPAQSPAESVGPSPSPSPQSSAATRDTKRKTDLGRYVEAYRATISNGYYATTPVAVSVNATDPSTNQAYQVTTTASSALGTISYLAGHQCNGKDYTPGKTSTKYVALTMKLETETAAYCLNINN